MPEDPRDRKRPETTGALAPSLVYCSATHVLYWRITSRIHCLFPPIFEAFPFWPLSWLFQHPEITRRENGLCSIYSLPVDTIRLLKFLLLLLMERVGWPRKTIQYHWIHWPNENPSLFFFCINQHSWTNTHHSWPRTINIGIFTLSLVTSFTFTSLLQSTPDGATTRQRTNFFPRKNRCSDFAAFFLSSGLSFCSIWLTYNGVRGENRYYIVGCKDKQDRRQQLLQPSTKKTNEVCVLGINLISRIFSNAICCSSVWSFSYWVQKLVNSFLYIVVIHGFKFKSWVCLRFC